MKTKRMLKVTCLILTMVMLFTVIPVFAADSNSIVIVRFFDDNGVFLAHQAVVYGQPINLATVPVPATRYGRPGIPGQVFMGWYTELFPRMHYVNNPNRATAFDLTQPITSDMLIGGVLDLHGSWLQHGDANGDGRVDIADFNLLTQRIMGMIGPQHIVLQAADVNADGVINMADHGLLNQFIMGHPVILGIPCPTL